MLPLAAMLGLEATPGGTLKADRFCPMSAFPRQHHAGRGAGEIRPERAARGAAQPAEMAPIYVLLASNESRYVTGMVYGATGGEGTA